MNKKLTYLDAFADAGGLATGLAKAGFNILYAFDYKSVAIESHNDFPRSKHCEEKDAHEITGEYILIKCREGELDLFAGGSPCQGFSYGGMLTVYCHC